MAHTYFTPVVDAYRFNESILPDYPKELIRENARLPTMIGVTTGECSAYITWLHFLGVTTLIYINKFSFAVTVKQKNIRVNLSDLEFVVPSVIYANAEQIKSAVYKQYVGDRVWQPTFDYGKALVDISSDQNFVAPAVHEARLYTNRNVSVYAYAFERDNEQLERKQVEYGLPNGSRRDLISRFYFDF